MLKEPQIYHFEESQVSDRDVPEFGGFDPAELHRPVERPHKPDVGNQDSLQATLVSGALARTAYAAGQDSPAPHVHYPNAEYFQHFPFPQQAWVEYGNMETELPRVRFMLHHHLERSFPVEYQSICQLVIQSADMLAEWQAHSPQLAHIGTTLYQNMQVRMHHAKKPDPYNYHNGEQGAFEAVPQLYQTSSPLQSLESQIWERALDQIASELHQGKLDPQRLSTFLDLYQHIKDPITPLKGILSNQVQVFLFLLSQVDLPESAEQTKALAAQLALESSFLALPDIQHIKAVGYGQRHELPYIYVDLYSLPRGELAGPQRVSEKIIPELMANSSRYGQPVMTPITVAHFQGPQDISPRLFIVDGNNRATAILLMKFLAEVDFVSDKFTDKNVLDLFIKRHRLDIEWERDLFLAINFLPEETLKKLLDDKQLVRQFAHSQIPALLTQESSFHTIAVDLSSTRSVTLLPPVFQALYNDSRFPIAIAAKHQSHGLSLDNGTKKIGLLP